MSELLAALDLPLEILSWVSLVLGGFFCLVGGFGMVHFDSFFLRIHAAGVTDSLGAALIILGLAFQATSVAIFIKLALLILFLWVTGPTATHALVKAAYAFGVKAEIDLPPLARDPDAPPVPEDEGKHGKPVVAGVSYETPP